MILGRVLDDIGQLQAQAEAGGVGLELRDAVPIPLGQLQAEQGRQQMAHRAGHVVAVAVEILQPLEGGPGVARGYRFPAEVDHPGTHLLHPWANGLLLVGVEAAEGPQHPVGMVAQVIIRRSVSRKGLSQVAGVVPGRANVVGKSPQQRALVPGREMFRVFDGVGDAAQQIGDHDRPFEVGGQQLDAQGKCPRHLGQHLPTIGEVAFRRADGRGRIRHPQDSVGGRGFGGYWHG